jgi:hypothetical protein
VELKLAGHTDEAAPRTLAALKAPSGGMMIVEKCHV